MKNETAANQLSVDDLTQGPTPPQSENQAVAQPLLGPLTRIASALQCIARAVRPPAEGNPADADPPGSVISTLLDNEAPFPSMDSEKQADSLAASSDRNDAILQELAEIRQLVKQRVLADDLPNRSFYWVCEVAEITDYKKWTLRQACNTGRIRAEKATNGQWRIPREQVEEILEKGLPTV